MAEHFLISVDLDALNDKKLKTFSFLDRVHLRVTRDNVQRAASFLKEHFGHFATFCDVTAVTETSDVVSLLDQGALKVVVSYRQAKAVLDALEDAGRLIVCIDDATSVTKEAKQELQALLAHAAVGIQANDVHGGEWLDAMQKRSKPPCSRYVALAPAPDIWDHYINAIKAGYVPIVPASSLTIDPTGQPHLLSVSRLLTGILHSDRPDGLFPTVVANEHGTCLGLVYSNEKSVETALKLGRGVYYSRSRNGIWIKGDESGDAQDLISIRCDCDADALRFIVRQEGDGFCHLKSSTCFGPYNGFARLEKTLQARRVGSPAGSYTARLYEDPTLLRAKIMEEASELCDASSKEDVAAEAADLFYFALTKCVAAGVKLEDVERNLDRKSTKITRRKGDAKPHWAVNVSQDSATNAIPKGSNGIETTKTVEEPASVPKRSKDPTGTINGRIQMRRIKTSETDSATLDDVLQRPSQRSTDEIMEIVSPIIKDVRDAGDAAVLKYTHKFDKATSLTSPVLRAPFSEDLMKLPAETLEAIDISFENIRRFHAAQIEERPLQVETMPGVVCSRFSRPIERVGLYVPGGTAVLPSTAMMLGVPAMVAGCKKIVIASPPRSDGTITPEIVYVAHKVGAESIVLAGGAQAVAAMAYGTESIAKVDKILGPGNQFVTAGKMIVANDTTAGVSIDMPAGPSEVLVIADKTAIPSFVASDLLSQAEHGTDSQVILVAVDLDEEHLAAIEFELHSQASALPRIDIVRGAIAHSITLLVKDIDEALTLSNRYAPEHLILQLDNAKEVVALVQNAGSVFVGHWTPESVGDYSAGVNHSLPTYGYAKQYSGVNLSSFTKHITSSNLTQEGLKNVGGAVMQMAKVEELEAHRRAVSMRLRHMERNGTGGGLGLGR